MKIIENDAVVNGGGTVYMVPQQTDDLWSLYSCISTGDLVSAQIDKVEIELKVDTVKYARNSSVMYIHGRRNLQILEIKQNSPCMLTKKSWSKSDLDSLIASPISSSGSNHSSSSSSKDSGEDLAVVLIPEQGIANIFLVGKDGCANSCAKIESKSPTRKHEKVVLKKGLHGNNASEISDLRQRSRTVAPILKETNNEAFFQLILADFKKHVDFKTIKHVVIAGPGGLKDKFYAYLFSEAKKSKLKSILDNKSRFLLVPTDTRNFKEILEIAAVKKFVKMTVDVEDSSVMDELDFLNATNPDRACYGWKSVVTANKLRAIQTLLVTEDLCGSSNAATKEKYVNLLESVKKSGGTTHVFSCNRDSGKRLKVLTGVAAILRFCVPNLDDIEL